MCLIQICCPLAYKTFEASNKQSTSLKRPMEEDGCQRSLKMFMRSTDDATVTTAIGKYLISSMRPMSEVENEGFTDMFASILPTYHLPSRRTISQVVISQCISVQELIALELKSTPYFAGQADIWSSKRMHGYFGLALSYIKDGCMKTRVVACRRFTGSHTGENIAAMFSTLIQECEVAGRMVAMVTDNAANMQKAFRVAAAESKSEDAEEMDEEEEVEETSYRTGVNWEEVQDEVTFPLPPRYSCVAHSLQLVVADGLKEATDRIKQVIAKCKKLISSVHMSCNATELLEKETGHNIPMANATRWSSMYQMIKAVTDTEQEHNGILTRLAETTGSSIRINAKEIATLKELCGLLEPLANATTRLQVPYFTMTIYKLQCYKNLQRFKKANLNTSLQFRCSIIVA